MKTFAHTQALLQSIVDEHGRDELLREVPELSPQFLRALLIGIKPLPAPIAFAISKAFNIAAMTLVHAHLEDCRDNYLGRVGA